MIFHLPFYIVTVSFSVIIYSFSQKELRYDNRFFVSREDVLSVLVSITCMCNQWSTKISRDDYPYRELEVSTLPRTGLPESDVCPSKERRERKYWFPDTSTSGLGNRPPRTRHPDYQVRASDINLVRVSFLSGFRIATSVVYLYHLCYL